MHSLADFLFNALYFVLDVANGWFGNQGQQVQPRTKKKVIKKG